MARTRITSDGVTHQVEIDGEDVTDKVTAVQLQVVANEPAQVILHARPDVCFDGDAIVTKPVAADIDELALIRDFLEHLDPEAVEADALANMEFGGGNIVAAVLETLVAYTKATVGA